MLRTTITVVLLCGAALHVADVCAETTLQPTQQALVDIYVRTKKCMVKTGTAARARGAKAAHTQYLMASVCGVAMQEFLTRDMTQERAVDIVARIARTTYFEDVLRAPEPLSFN
jgi:hypothetical protein